jgi:hypothetical protein
MVVIVDDDQLLLLRRTKSTPAQTGSGTLSGAGTGAGTAAAGGSIVPHTPICKTPTPPATPSPEELASDPAISE